MRDIGRSGGSVKSEAKSAAARENGKKGGRPRKAAWLREAILRRVMHSSAAQRGPS